MNKIQGLTLKRAKEIVRERNGHLPKCGYETIALTDTVTIHNVEHSRDIWLYNSSGTYKLRESIALCFHCPIIYVSNSMISEHRRLHSQ